MFLFPLNSYQKIHSNTYERNMAFSIACYWCYNSAWKTLVAMVSGHQYQYELLLYFSVNIVIGCQKFKKDFFCQKCHVSRQREKCFIERMILLYLKRDRSKKLHFSFK